MLRSRVEIAVLDPFHGYKNATKVVDDARRRVQQQIHGHRGRNGDPLYGIRNLLRADAEHLTTASSRSRSSTRSPPARSPRSHDWDAHCGRGGASSSANSTPAVRATAAPKPSVSLIELHRRIARGFRNRGNYRLRMLLIGGGLLPYTTLNGEEPVFVRR